MRSIDRTVAVAAAAAPATRGVISTALPSQAVTHQDTDEFSVQIPGTIFRLGKPSVWHAQWHAVDNKSMLLQLGMLSCMLLAACWQAKLTESGVISCSPAITME